MKNALPVSQIMEIYAILREVSTLPVTPTPGQIGRLWAMADFQCNLLRMRIDDITNDVEVGA
jgi:hypothetical protein